MQRYQSPVDTITTSTQIPSSLAAATELPEDVLMEILLRLSVKSLLRFRSVCKNWCALIQDPRFVALHQNRAKSNNDNNDSMLVVRSIRTGDRPEYQEGNNFFDSKLVLSFLPNEGPISLIDIDMHVLLSSSQMFVSAHRGCLLVLGPCNGIICITNLGDIVLCNPATREFKTLPVPPFSYPRDMHSSCKAVGFGFDPNDDDYKVVRIVKVYEEGGFDSYYDPGSLKFEIYNLSTDCWREVDGTLQISVHYQPCFELLFNGAFHWYGLDDSFHGLRNDDYFESIISFDINREVFRLIEFPDVCSYWDGKQRSLLVLNESLALILYNPSEVEKYFDIWVMNEYGVKESWTKQFRIGPLPGINFPLAFGKDDEFLMESRNGQLVSCNLLTQDIKEFQVHGVPKTLRALLYTESLTSIKRSITLADQLG